MSSPQTSPRPARPMLVAVVLGTALSALSAPAEQVTDYTRAVSEIGRYCTTCWRNARLPADSWSDCTQEVLCRLLRNVPLSRWEVALRGDGEENREFLRAIDTVKKRTQRAHRYGDAIDSVADRRDDLRRRLAEEREVVDQAAAQLLSVRQQRIVQLSLEGWSVADIADELALPVERVSDEKYKAIRKLRGHLATQEA
jgi:RNA polymerase sigma factor (sigma-70 family)